jgi:hypothetical protein
VLKRVGETMASSTSLDALHAATSAIQRIQQELQPVLTTIRTGTVTTGTQAVATTKTTTENDVNSNRMQLPQGHEQQVALAQTAVALTLGTLRFLRPRLLLSTTAATTTTTATTATAARASTSEPVVTNAAAAAATTQGSVRQELNRIRQLLVTLQKSEPDSGADASYNDNNDTATDGGTNASHNTATVVAEKAKTLTSTTNSVDVREETSASVTTSSTTPTTTNTTTTTPIATTSSCKRSRGTKRSANRHKRPRT